MSFSIKVLIILVIPLQVFSQQEIKIKYKDGYRVFTIIDKPNDFEFKSEREYHWYNDIVGMVKSTEGGSGGRLLHGISKFYNLDGDLLSQTDFEYGLIEGEEKVWNEDNELIEVTRIENGYLVYNKKKSGDKWIERDGLLLKVGSTLKIFSESGKLEYEEILIEDSVIGLIDKVKEYYFDGELKKVYYEDFYHENLYYNDYKEYNLKNGKLKFLAKYDSLGYPTGAWKWYTDDGKLEKSVDFKFFEKKDTINDTVTFGAKYYDSTYNKWQKHGNWFLKTDEGFEKYKYEWGEKVEE